MPFIAVKFTYNTNLFYNTNTNKWPTITNWPIWWKYDNHVKWIIQFTIISTYHSLKVLNFCVITCYLLLHSFDYNPVNIKLINVQWYTLYNKQNNVQVTDNYKLYLSVQIIKWALDPRHSAVSSDWFGPSFAMCFALWLAARHITWPPSGILTLLQPRRDAENQCSQNLR